jgi:short-subunit dehydrogenase
VTGASSGIGEAFSKVLAGQGVDVVLVARRRQRLEALAEAIRRDHDVRALVVEADLAERDCADEIAVAVREAGLSIDLLVNNAGFGLHGPFEQHDPQAALRMVDVNCRAPLALTYAFLPQMIERRRGAIIFVSSVAGFQPTPFYTTYGATKAFDLMIAEALWAELGPKGIDVLALCPGHTPTEFQQVAGSPGRSISSTVDEVVAAAMASLGRRPSVIPGSINQLLAWAVRFAPRALVAKMAFRHGQPAEVQR